MQALTEELYTYRNILFPRTPLRRVGIHIAFWYFFIGYHLLFFIPSHLERLTNERVLSAYILYYGRYIPVYYLMVFFFRFLRSRVRGISRLLFLALFVITVYHIITFCLFNYYESQTGIEHLPDGFQLLGRYYLDPFAAPQGKGTGVMIYDLSELQLFILPVCIKTLKYSIMLIMGEADRQQGKLRAELKYLRFQLTPHFILNVLNAAYTEISRSPRKLAASYLLQVADMIRFAIYDAEQEFIPLEKELNYLEQYLRLEGARTVHRSEIFFTKMGEIHTNHQVPTLLLITLVENAFKHGVHITTKPCEIIIQSEVTGDRLHFEVVNSKPELTEAAQPTSENRGGIGLDNIKKTLSLKFGASHQFTIKETALEFSVVLELPLLASDVITVYKLM